MGSSLGSPQRSLSAPKHPKSKPWPEWVQQSSIPKVPPHLHMPQRVVGTWRRSAIRPPTDATLGLDLSSAWDTYMKRWLWSVRNPGWTCSPVTVKIAPPEGRGSSLTSLRQGARIVEHPEELPDPCAKETVLRALSQCKKGTRRFDGPLWFEVPEVKNRRQNSESTPSSAFKPWINNGVAASFVPKPGPLNRSIDYMSFSVFKKEADLQPSIPTAMHAVSETHMESSKKTQASCDPCLSGGQKTEACGVSLMGGESNSYLSSVIPFGDSSELSSPGPTF
ncbi:POM121-like protein 12 [Apodemus sylvaticus]|uniref:POM121-like protein 12 n=1 Tax=Apodemus sylvaticus TaxID=10129 RepID=UPI00224221B2|nr:POM121-like protein 12 [Apodemus sylvaticus]